MFISLKMIARILLVFVLIGSLNAKNLDAKNVKVDLSQYPGELCNRECKKRETQICHFRFVLESYHTVGP